jgi:hypothetical protein
MSSAATTWGLRKLSTIIPNNRRIVNLLNTHKTLLDPAEFAVACEFIEHAEGFESSAYERREDVPRFPVAFADMVRR